MYKGSFHRFTSSPAFLSLSLRLVRRGLIIIRRRVQLLLDVCGRERSGQRPMALSSSLPPPPVLLAGNHRVCFVLEAHVPDG
jgi:hypothetical protein